LQGAIDAFDGAFGLGRIGADQLDVQILHRLPKLGPLFSVIALIEGLKNAMAIGVEGLWTAVASQMTDQESKVTAGALFFVQVKSQERAGRIVDRNMEGGAGAALFEPAMDRCIELDQLAKASSAFTRKVLGAGFAPRSSPETGTHHRSPQRLVVEAESMPFGEFFGRKRRSKIWVVAANDCDRLRDFLGVNSPVTWPTAPRRC
jgi:hypothetical protein